MPAIALIALPYDSGRSDLRMGRGPGAILSGGIVEELRSRNFEVEVRSLRINETFQTEGSALVELQRQAVPAIREALARGAQPILLSGNCGPAALSASAALGAKTTGVIWFDAHGDFNTPETSSSGFLDGMGLSILTGDCWQKLAASLENFAPIPAEQIIQIGVRDLDAGEALRLEQSAITRIGSQELARLPAALRQLSGRVAQVYVHVDVDVLDVSEGRANTYACGAGLSLADLERALELIAEIVPIAAGSITSYDPAADRDGRIGRAIARIVERLTIGRRLTL